MKACELDRMLTQPLHRQLAKENPNVIPSASIVDRHAKTEGTTADWVREHIGAGSGVTAQADHAAAAAAIERSVSPTIERWPESCFSILVHQR